MQQFVNHFSRACDNFGFTISTKKTEVMHQPAPRKMYHEPHIFVNDEPLNATDSFTYLGSTLSREANIDVEVNNSLSKANYAFGRLRKKVWDRRGISQYTKLKVYMAVVLTVLLYACESWTVYSRHARKLNHFHTKWLRIILSIKWQDMVPFSKPNKPKDEPKSYRPISLLCIPYKIVERLIYNRISPVIDPQLPQEQAGFRPGRSTLDQVAKLTSDIELAFDGNLKGGDVFVDLTAAYDAVWRRGLMLKLLRMLPNRHMVRFISELISNHSVVVKTSDGQQSRLKRINNGVPKRSVLSPLLFNVYIADLPQTNSK